MSARSARVCVVGAGLAGLVAATGARAAGADVVVLEGSVRPGGATASSAGWIWRYVDRRIAAAAAPHGDPTIRDLLVEALDADLRWLEAQGVAVRERDTGRPTTVGARIDPVQAVERLAGPLDVRVEREVRAIERVDGSLQVVTSCTGSESSGRRERLEVDAVVLAGGGYAGDLDRVAREAGVAIEARRSWVLRAPHAGTGSSTDAAVALGAVRPVTTGESLVRLVASGPALDDAPGAAALIRAGELQVPGSRLLDPSGAPVPAPAHDWSGAMAAWELARIAGHGVLELPAPALATPLHAGGTAGDAIDALRSSGAEGGTLPRGGAWLRVRAGITATRCGIRIDREARVLDRHGVPIAGLFAAGIDAADPALGGAGSGLALALVLGRRAGTGAAAATNSRTR
jgi:hypothetical protein